MQHKWLLLTAVGGLIAFSPFAKADEWDKRTVITFHQPVEIPGMVLAPGTYVMKLLDSPSDRDIVQFFNPTETRIFNTVLAIPAYRDEPSEHTVITFEERTAGAPQAIKDWYYPGDLRGEEFVYSKPHPMSTAQAASPAPQPSHAEAKPAPAPAQAMTPRSAAAPTSQPMQIAQAKPAPSPAPAPSAENSLKETSAKTLPKTASEVPLAGLLGLLSLAGGVALRKRSA